MNIGRISESMGIVYNQFVDGRISGLNLALSVLSEQINNAHTDVGKRETRRICAIHPNG